MAKRAKAQPSPISPELRDHVQREISAAYQKFEETFSHLHAISLMFQSVAECTCEYDTTEPVASAGMTVAKGMNERMEQGFAVLRDLQVILMGVQA